MITINAQAAMTSALVIALSLIGCDSSARQTKRTPNEVKAMSPPAAPEPPPTHAPPDAQAAIQALKLKGTITHKLLRLNPHVELLLLERELSGQPAQAGEEVLELRKEAWLVHKAGDAFEVLAHTDHGECEDYELTLTPVEALESLSLFTVGCANGADYWSKSEDITLLYHSYQGRTPSPIWSQVIHHSNEMDQCTHHTQLLISRAQDTLHIKTISAASWSKTEEDPDIEDLDQASCEQSVAANKTYTVELKP